MCVVDIWNVRAEIKNVILEIVFRNDILFGWGKTAFQRFLYMLS